MKTEFLNKIISILLLVILLAPLSIQFNHSFKSHSFQDKQNKEFDVILNTEKNCAIYHQQINHNAVDLQFDFDINFPQIINQDIQIILTESYQCYNGQKSSRAPPISFV